jgi:hypothetical protein
LYRIETDGRRQLSEPEPYTGCSASKDENLFFCIKLFDNDPADPKHVAGGIY